MRKLAIALAAVIGMTTAAQADWNGHRHHQPRHYHNGGGDAGAALFGGLVGGLIIGGMLSNSQQGYYNEPPYGYVPAYRRYQPVCQNVFMGSYWNGWRWVNQYQVICD